MLGCARKASRVASFLLVITVLFGLLPTAGLATDSFNLTVSGIGNYLLSNKTYTRVFYYTDTTNYSYELPTGDINAESCNLENNNQKITTVALSVNAADLSKTPLRIEVNGNPLSAPTTGNSVSQSIPNSNVTVNFNCVTNDGGTYYICQVTGSDNNLYDYLSNCPLIINWIFEENEFNLTVSGIGNYLLSNKTYTRIFYYTDTTNYSYELPTGDINAESCNLENSNQKITTVALSVNAADLSKTPLRIEVNGNPLSAPTTGNSVSQSIPNSNVTVNFNCVTNDGGTYYICQVTGSDNYLYDYLSNCPLIINWIFEENENEATYRAVIADSFSSYADAVFVGKNSDTAQWRIKVKSAPSESEFDYWSFSPYVVDADTSAWGIHDDPLEVSLSAATGDVTFTPNFRLLGVTLLDGLRFGEMYEVNEAYQIMPPGKIGDRVAPISKTLITGATALCSIPFSIPSLVSDAVELTASIYSGSTVNESNLICSQTYSQNYLTAGEHALFIELPAQNSAITQVTVSVVFKTNAGTRDAVVKTYPLSCIFPAAQESSSLQYLEETGTTVPMGYFTQAAAVVDSLTGNLTLIAASERSNESLNSTLYVLSADGASLTLSDTSGLTDLVKVKELTAGPDGTIWAYVTSTVEVGNDNGAAGYLAKYQNGAWTLITASKCGEQTSNGYVAADIGHIVAAGTNVIAYDKTWNGSEWITGGHGKTGVAQMDGVYYGCDAQGVYSFDPENGWTQLLSGSYAYEITDAAAGKLLICRHTESSKDLLLIDVTAKTVASISTELFSSRGIVGNPAGLDRNGIPCFIVVGCNTYNLDQFGHNAIGVLFKYIDGQWVNMKEAAFWADSENPNQYETKTRPAAINTTMNPVSGITLYGAEFGSDYHAGSVYIELGNSTITFDPGAGILSNAALGTMSGKMLSVVDRTKVPGASRDNYDLVGWFYDAEGTVEWDADTAHIPAKDITLYAKWREKGTEAEQLAWYREKAIASLEKQYNKFSSEDYTSENWAVLQAAYETGKDNINAATAGTERIEDNVTAALNAAVAAMQAVPAKDTSKATIAVSMDANTLGLGYLLEPTLVTVDKGTPVSVVITDLLSAQAAEKYGITEPGRTTKADVENLSTLYPWVSDGAPRGGFYLAQVYDPDQTGYSIPATLQNYITVNSLQFNESDKNGKYLGEFDYLTTSGWVYSVGNKSNGNAEFPGVGSSGWGVSDGEVVRWQFTLVGYGADLGADNTAWGTENIVTVGDKSALTWKVAELRSQYSDATLKAENVYTDALAVLADAEATQEEVDAALAALRGETFTEPVTGVSLDQTELSVTVGKTAELTATVEPDNATDKTMTWSSSDETVATVADGVVTGVKAGTATITVTTTDGGKTASCAVTVVEEAIPVSGVTLDKESAELTVGDTLTLTATVAPSGAADKSVTWSSSDESVATVADGVVTAVNAGTATITVTTTDGGKTASCAVTVKAAPVAVTGVTLDKTTVEVKAGETVTLTATVAPEDATDMTVTWSSSNVTIATVENGVVTGVKAGSVTITATASGKTATCTVTVTAAEEQPTELTYPEALKAVQDYLKKESPNPGVGSKGGEWAVFALNRGGAAEEDWNNKYLAALQTYVAENDGVLHEKKYTEYSRVVIALTSMGVDATQFQAGEKTYDLVTPLLDKQNNGKTWAEWQGNNGTAFALLALDSHNYLDNEEGNAIRAALIASLKANQQENGGWPISGESVDLDVTAAAIYALAPYLNAGRASVVGVSVSDVQAMIDKALAFLSSKQNENGGFGSAEADGWVIIALSTLGRDADTDKQFVKNGKSVLDDLLSYFDETKGGFKHLADGSVDQMASEQAAYDLAAYDRFKKGQNTLYDMTDVTFPDPEAPTVDVTGVTLDKTEASVEEGKTVTLTATIQPENATDKVVIWTSSDETVATVVNGTVTGVKAGSATITATVGGKSASCAVTVTAATGTTPGGQDKKTISVTMRLIGAEKASKDVDLGATPAYLPDYVTWIPTTSYELDEGATVYDLWVTATGDAGIRSVGADKNYVETVYAPEEGYALSEFTNGKRSGWMYTINGSHPGYGLVEQTLHNGDTVIWHYINDYSYECADWFGGDDRWPSLGDGTYYNQWLKAPDTYLGKGGGISDSGTTPGTTPGGTTPGGAATGSTDTDEVKLSAEEVKAAADENGDLAAETGNGTVKLDAATLDALAETGEEVVVSVKENEDGTVTVDVTAGDKSVDADVKVELPAEDGQVLVIVNEDGTEEIVKKSVVEDGKAYAEIPAGATVKVIDNDKEFVDVAEGAWYAEAVEFASSHDLFKGVGDDKFAPAAPMTRAMLATVLYRLEDAAATGTNPFDDVADGTWYTDAVTWANEEGIVMGTGKGFDPNANITREQIATMLYRYAKVIGLDVSESADLDAFPDGGETASWAKDAMQWAVSAGLFRGDDNGALNPKGDATRAEVATLLMRMVELIVK